jgi:hypothetical protein
MKVSQLIEQFEDIPLNNEWNTLKTGGYATNDRANWERERRLAITQRDLTLFYRLDSLIEDYPQDIAFQSFESAEEDHHRLSSWNTEVPKIVKEDPQAFAQIQSPGAWLDEDLMTGPMTGDGREHDEWDDVYELYFVRKSKPSLVNIVTSIIKTHQRLKIEKSNLWKAK